MNFVIAWGKGSGDMIGIGRQNVAKVENKYMMIWNPKIIPIWFISSVFVSTMKCPVITNNDTIFERYSEAAPLAVFFCIIISCPSQ